MYQTISVVSTIAYHTISIKQEEKKVLHYFAISTESNKISDYFKWRCQRRITLCKMRETITSYYLNGLKQFSKLFQQTGSNKITLS